MEKLIKRPLVEEMTGKSTTVLYRDMAAGTFPKPLKIGSRAVAWRESEIRAWLDARIAARDAA